uniref:Uncharacterized protein n=1 Tax=Anguilla anguilla TaxID=7936 RepID=A0A0E9XN30_ANGAN
MKFKLYAEFLFVTFCKAVLGIVIYVKTVKMYSFILHCVDCFESKPY